MDVKYIRLCILGIGALFLLSSCATGFIYNSIFDEKALTKELSWPDDQYEQTYRWGPHFKIPAFYIGIVEKDGNSYYAIVLDKVRRGNSGAHQVLLLIPSNKEQTPIIEEYDNPNSNVRGEVDVILSSGIFCDPYVPGNDGYCEKYAWSGYPRNITIGYNRENSSKPNLRVQYRFGGGDKDVETKPIVDRLSWKRRSRLLCVGMYLSYPITIAFDVVTSPVQFLLLFFLNTA